MSRTESSGGRTVAAPSSFTDALRAAADELRLEPLAPTLLNQIAARVDRLGRRVHGLGLVCGYEMGGCLTAAVSELSRAREQPEADRSDMVRQALGQLQAALVHADVGLRPLDTPSVAALPGQEVIHGA